MTHDACTVLHMPFEAVSARRARHVMTAELAGAAPGQVLYDAGLVLTELIANAVRHGAADADDRLEAGWCLLQAHLRVCVVDAGTGADPAVSVPDVPSDAEAGRGLVIVDTLASTWDQDLVEGRTRVTADIPLGFTRLMRRPPRLRPGRR